jgi:hypothetical protein
MHSLYMHPRLTPIILARVENSHPCLKKYICDQRGVFFLAWGV